MKSINFESTHFSMEDFERGLMLAGLISPSSVQEVSERKALEEYEAQDKQERSAVYFKRAVLAAEIVCELHSEPTFGRIKFQKMVYLCEHMAKMSLENRYSKQAAGPFDNKFMHSIESEFNKQKWFKVEKKRDGEFNKTKYLPLAGMGGHKKYFESYFGTLSQEIRYVIDLFRNHKTDFTEIAATLLACFWELREKGREPDEENLLVLFYDWSDKKSRFDRATVLATWRWMGDKKLVDNSL